MAIRTLDHVNIHTPRVAETLRFYGDLLGMRAAPPPGSDDMARGAWIYDPEGRPVVHVVSSELVEGSVAGEGSGRVHHVAFECSDYDAMRADLEARDAVEQLNEVAEIGLRQIFVRDPNGILLELNFR